MIIPMVKAHIYGPRDLLDQVTTTLYGLGVLHLEQLPSSMTSLVASRDIAIDDRDSAREKVELEIVLDKVKKALILLRQPEHGTGRETYFLDKDPRSPDTVAAVENLHKEIETAYGREKEIRDRLALLRRYEKMMRSLIPIIDNMPDTEHLEMVGLTISTRSEEVLRLIEMELTRITGGHYHLFTSELDEETSAAILAFGSSYAPRIKELLWEKNLNELKLPSDLENLPLREALKTITGELESLPLRLKHLEEETAVISKQWYYPLSRFRDYLEEKLSQVQAQAAFFKTRYSFAIAGWIPTPEYRKVIAAINERFGGKVMAVTVPVPEEERETIPVHMVNHPLIRPFEVFVKLLPLPVYGTIDPTPFFAFFFPLFFGFIMGDIGYGLIAMAIALLIRKKVKPGAAMHDIATVLAYSSVLAIVFGVVFGEFLGTLGEHWGIHPFTVAGVKLDRMKEISVFLGLAVAVGVVHVFLGVVLGAINAVRLGHKKHLIFKIGQFVSLASLILLIAGLAMGFGKPLLIITGLLLTAGLVTVSATEGFIAPIEILSAMGNILSYARLMAVGLSGVILALVANEMGKMSSNLFVGILIASCIHIINIAMGIFSPTIHSMRLHLVEFFGKFYETGGVQYKPFKRGGK